MSPIDLIIFILYAVIMLFIGFFFYRKNQGIEDYFVGGRQMSSWHVGLSVVATDVGGGFSIGLGGLGFTMGISGSWMLFTGLLGAWLSAVLLIPQVCRLSKKIDLLTFPQIFSHYYGPRTAIIAAVISFIGYLGFTSSQILAGAKLASATFPTVDFTTLLVSMGIFTVIYTAVGGLKAVIFTDTIQWLILMVGLIAVGLPIAYYAVGGYDAIAASVPAEFLQFTNISWSQIINWSIIIIPIWFIGMTLYQRIFACKNERDAKKAWFIAGLFEWPIMALLGVSLGLIAKAAYVQGLLPGMQTDDPELGLPILLATVLPIGFLGLLMSAYFSAIMSTADSCLMAASGNFVTDLLGRFVKLSDSAILRISQLSTLVLGFFAVFIALYMTSVLELMLLSYSFMVSGLFIPVLGILFLKNHSALAANSAMLLGGGSTILLVIMDVKIPYELDVNAVGLSLSLLVYATIHTLSKNKLSTN